MVHLAQQIDPVHAAIRTAGATPKSEVVEPDVPSGDDAKRDAELAVDAAAIVDVFYNGRPKLTPDGKKVVFRSFDSWRRIMPRFPSKAEAARALELDVRTLDRNLV